MICSTCNLHYPDHLNFCRRCGNTLAETHDEPVVESPCCTRCGARFVSGENFCQQCGYRLIQRSQETVVGGCYGCGTPWRSGWLYCRKCGLDRDQALIGPVSASAEGVAEGVTPEGSEFEEVERIPCPVCGVSIRPYSRFCESCGGSVAPYSRPISGPSDAGTTRSVGVDPGAEGVEPDVLGGTAPGGEAGASQPPGQPIGSLQIVPVGRLSQVDQGRREGAGRQPGSAGKAAGKRDGKRPARSSTPRGTGRGVNGMTPSPARSKPTAGLGWRSFGWISVGVIVLGVAVSWWFLSDNRASGSAADQPAANRTDVTPAVVAGEVPAEGDAGNLSERVVPEGMVLIEGGVLRMGREDGDKYEQPVHEVRVSSFYLDLTEVTNEMYLRYVRASGARSPSHWKDGLYPEGEARFPVVNVSWTEATAYAEWTGKRLPQESEWEFAARGSGGGLYPWGNEWRSGCGNAGNIRSGKLMRVGSFPDCGGPYGLLDLIGNAWEWTADRMVKYDDPGVVLAAGRVIRGGAFDAKIEHSTATYRGVVPEGRGYEKTGFRCAMNVR